MKAANTIVEEKSITDSTSSGDESSASCQSGTNNKPRTSTNQRRKLRFLTTSTHTDNDTPTITDGKMSGDIITSDKNFITEVKNDYIDNSSTSTPLIGENSNKLDTKSTSKVNSPTHSELESL